MRMIRGVMAEFAEKNMRASTVTCIGILVSLGGSPAWAEEIKVPFLQAAIFVITGKKPPNDVIFENDKKAVVRDYITIYPKNDPISARFAYEVRASEPCTVYAFLMEPRDARLSIDNFSKVPNGTRRVDFMKLPSPRTMRHSSASDSAIMNLPDGAWCCNPPVRAAGY
jgi:hypothetical protein